MIDGLRRSVSALMQVVASAVWMCALQLSAGLFWDVFVHMHMYHVHGNIQDCLLTHPTAYQ